MLIYVPATLKWERKLLLSDGFVIFSVIKNLRIVIINQNFSQNLTLVFN